MTQPPQDTAVIERMPDLPTGKSWLGHMLGAGKVKADLRETYARIASYVAAGVIYLTKQRTKDDQVPKWQVGDTFTIRTKHLAGKATVMSSIAIPTPQKCNLLLPVAADQALVREKVAALEWCRAHGNPHLLSNNGRSE